MAKQENIKGFMMNKREIGKAIYFARKQLQSMSEVNAKFIGIGAIHWLAQAAANSGIAQQVRITPAEIFTQDGRIDKRRVRRFKRQVRA